MNHLQNVLVTISDKKIGVDVAPQDGIIDYYNADIITANDYYPGGMDMPRRSYSSGSQYRYGFNGKEKDNKDGVVQYDYGFRIYDPRLVRFKSVDPLSKEYPWYTPYQFAGNSPIQNIDLDGLEEVHYSYIWFDGYRTKIALETEEVRSVPKKGLFSTVVENVTTNVKNWWNSSRAEATKGVLSVTDIDDASVLLYDKHVDGEDAGLMDKAFTLVPVVGGKVLKQVLKKAEYLKYLKGSGYSSKVATSIVERGGLRGALKLVKNSLDAAHHIIPVKALKESKVVQDAIDAGFDFNSATNGIPIPKNLHGSHPNYTTYVTDALNAWAKDKKYTPQQAREFIQNEFIPNLEKKLNDATSQGQKLNEYFKPTK